MGCEPCLEGMGVSERRMEKCNWTGKGNLYLYLYLLLAACYVQAEGVRS